MQNVIVLFLAMSASGLIGFYIARERYGGRIDQQLQVLGHEMRRMRRRARNAEAQSGKLRIERDRLQKVVGRRVPGFCNFGRPAFRGYNDYTEMVSFVGVSSSRSCRTSSNVSTLTVSGLTTSVEK